MLRSKKILILCDFDGTVSTKDTVNKLIREHLKAPDWRFHVKRYFRGEIGSREVYQAVAPLMRMTQKDLTQFVRENASLDPHFTSFLRWAQDRRVDVKILSDGFEATIGTLFRSHDIEKVDIFANKLIIHDEGTVAIESPHANRECGICGTCKLGVLRRFRQTYDTIILIGDGESDRHAAEEADLVIAMKDLFLYCAQKGIPCIRAGSFKEIPHLLTRRIQSVTFDLDGTLLDSLHSITESFNHMFEALGYPHMTVQQVARKTGISLKDFVCSFLKPEEAQAGIKIFRDHYDSIFLDKTKVIPGVIEMLHSLDGGVVKGIVTNKRGKYARTLARHFSLDKHMVHILGAEDGFKAKPSSEMFDAFIERSGALRENTIYVGDAPVDIEAAINAGIDAYVIANPIFSSEELALYSPRRILKDINELSAAVTPIV
ncbi:MAG: hypothetical protein QG577_1328 [Thermodesulfobacteriota bacterium]|nr:hypothetical protein [Thermodesulfobacteriota bacterium]